MITAHDVSMGFGGRVLFDHVNVTFNDGERYGLTGPNGAGKSTFMGILAGGVEPTSGNVSVRGRLGVLEQDHSSYADQRILDVVLSGHAALWAALHQKEQILAKGDDLDDEDGMLLGELEIDRKSTRLNSSH